MMSDCKEGYEPWETYVDKEWLESRIENVIDKTMDPNLELGLYQATYAAANAVMPVIRKIEEVRDVISKELDEMCVDYMECELELRRKIGYIREQSIDLSHLTPDQQQRVRLFVKGLGDE